VFVVHAQTVRNERAYGCLRPVVAKSDGGIRLWRSHARAVRPQQKALCPVGGGWLGHLDPGSSMAEELQEQLEMYHD
jgi:hypothetical protein